jgi:hypothetical protein
MATPITATVVTTWGTDMKTVLALDVYRPGQWHDFLVMVGGGAAALTGLVFVALSLNLNVVTQDATHRYRPSGPSQAS